MTEKTFNSKKSIVKVAENEQENFSAVTPEILQQLAEMEKNIIVRSPEHSGNLPTLPTFRAPGGESSRDISNPIDPSQTEVYSTNDIQEMMKYLDLNERETRNRNERRRVPRLDTESVLKTRIKPLWDAIQVGKIYDKARPYVGEGAPEFVPRNDPKHSENDLALKKVIDHANDVRSGKRDQQSIADEYFDDDQAATPKELQSLGHRGTAVQYLSDPFHDVHGTYNQALRAREQRERSVQRSPRTVQAQAALAFADETMRKSEDMQCPVCKGHPTGGMEVAGDNEIQEQCPGGCSNTGSITFSSDPHSDADLSASARFNNAMRDRHEKFCQPGRNPSNPNDIGCLSDCPFREDLRNNLLESEYDENGNLVTGLPTDVIGLSTGRKLKGTIKTSDTHLRSDSPDSTKKILMRDIVSDEYREPAPAILVAQTGNAGPDGMAPLKQYDFAMRVPERKAELQPPTMEASVVNPEYGDNNQVKLDQQGVIWINKIDSNGNYEGIEHSMSDKKAAEHLRLWNKSRRTFQKRTETSIRKHKDKLDAAREKYLSLQPGTPAHEKSAKKLAELSLKMKSLESKANDSQKSVPIDDGLRSTVSDHPMPIDTRQSSDEIISDLKDARNTEIKRNNLRLVFDKLNPLMGTRIPVPRKRGITKISSTEGASHRLVYGNIHRDGLVRVTHNTMPFLLYSGAIVQNPSAIDEDAKDEGYYGLERPAGQKYAQTDPERKIIRRAPSGMSAGELVEGYKGAVARGDQRTADVMRDMISGVVKKAGYPESHPDNLLSAIKSMGDVDSRFNYKRPMLERMRARRAAGEPISKIIYEPGEVMNSSPIGNLTDDHYLEMANQIAAIHSKKNPDKPQLGDRDIEEVANAIKNGGHISHGYKKAGLDYDEIMGNY